MTLTRRNVCGFEGSNIKNFQEEQKLTCALCGGRFPANAACEAGHFVCDACHARRGLEVIRAVCEASCERDPIVLMQQIMADPFLYMHGPEHHVLVGSALLTAYRNSGGALDWPDALDVMEERGRQVPGGACGFWGCCGAAVSAGIFVSIAVGATPLTGESWGLANRMTGLALTRIGALGGPRCCKRDSFTAVLAAVGFSREHLGVSMETPEQVVCTFSKENAQCLGRRCPYHQTHYKQD